MEQRGRHVRAGTSPVVTAPARRISPNRAGRAAFPVAPGLWRDSKTTSAGGQAETGAEPVLEEHGVARRQRARRILRRDLDDEEARALATRAQSPRKILDLRQG